MSDDKKNDETEPPAAQPAAGGTRFKPPIRRESQGGGGVEPPKQRGLNAVEASRKERNRIKRPPMRVIGWFLLITAVALALYFRHSAGKLDRDRQRLLADQRATEAELGKIWFPLRDKVEKWTVDLATAPADRPEVIEKEALADFKFQDMAGLYLRLRVDQAQTPEAVRKGVEGSLRDAFTSCLMRTPVGDPMAGKECKTATDCEPGQLCNEFYHCSVPGQPYNLRLAYKSLFVLTPEWIKDVQDVDSDLRLRALRGTFDQANRIEFPIAVTLLTSAKFFLVVLDEKEGAPPAPPPVGSAAPAVSAEDEDTLSGKPHAIRVGLWRLSDDKPLLQLRRTPQAQLRESAGSIAVDSAARAATLRQAQSCELAQEVRCVVGDPGASCGK